MNTLAAVLIAVPMLAAAGEQAPFDLRVLAVSVNGELDDEAFEFSPISGNAGTCVTVLLSDGRADSGRSIVSVDTEASKLSRFEDAGGNDLLQPVEDRPRPGFGFTAAGSPIDPFPKISRDGSMAALDLSAPRVPGTGSGAVRVNGTLFVRVASGTVTRKTRPLPLRPGTTADAESEIDIGAVGPPDWGDAKMAVTLNMPTDTVDRIAAIRFLDAGGKEIESSRSSTMTMPGTARVQYTLGREVDSAAIEFTFHDRLERVEVPVDLKVTLGLE